MTTNLNQRSKGLGAMAVVAVIFGLLTIISGGRVLFDPAAGQAAGNYVGFVVWFNFIAGFAYVVAGAGLWRRLPWAVWLAGLIAAATVIVFAAFGLYILGSGAFEPRTVAAMGLRSGVWLIIAIAAFKILKPQAGK